MFCQVCCLLSKLFYENVSTEGTLGKPRKNSKNSTHYISYGGRGGVSKFRCDSRNFYAKKWPKFLWNKGRGWGVLDFSVALSKCENFFFIFCDFPYSLIHWFDNSYYHSISDDRLTEILFPDDWSFIAIFATFNILGGYISNAALMLGPKKVLSWYIFYVVLEGQHEWIFRNLILVQFIFRQSPSTKSLLAHCCCLVSLLVWD